MYSIPLLIVNNELKRAIKHFLLTYVIPSLFVVIKT